jgi:hypothetical protein
MRFIGTFNTRLTARLIALALAVNVGAAGQAPAPRPGAWKAPRAAGGHPDLQGVWNFSTVTPMERPRALANKEFLTEAEAAAYEAQAAKSGNRDFNVPEGNVGDYNNFWYDRGQKVIGSRRTSLVIDPPDGRIPPLTPDAERRRTERGANSGQLASQRQPVKSYEELPLIERCYLGFNSGPPMTPSAYNNNMQLFQNADTVAIVTEMIHEVRIVPIGASPHGTVRQWLGDSRGHWEGDTLVVDTVNFRAETNFNPKGHGVQPDASRTLHLIERFTRMDPDTLRYQFTVDDPATWTKPWTAEIQMARAQDQHLYEYACHEGNYGLVGMLKGALVELGAK